MWDLERVWVRLSSLSQGRGSGRRDGGALPVSALGHKKRRMPLCDVWSGHLSALTTFGFENVSAIEHL